MIIQCPYCNTPLMKGMEELRHLAVNFSFETKCAHCQKMVTVELLFERIVIINQEHKTTKLGPDSIRIINN